MPSGLPAFCSWLTAEASLLLGDASHGALSELREDYGAASGKLRTCMGTTLASTADGLAFRYRAWLEPSA